MFELVTKLHGSSGMDEHRPQQTPFRVVYLTMYVVAVIMLTSYSATLISFLAVRTIELPFNDLEEFLRAGTHKLGALEHSTTLSFFRVSTMTTHTHTHTEYENHRPTI
jgi:hypothetical protein